MEIKQEINLGTYSVVKTGDTTTGHLISNFWDSHGTLVCCLPCHRAGKTEEKHVVQIVTACRALGITTLIAGRLWHTIIPSITTVRVLESGKREEVATDEQEKENFQTASKIITWEAREKGRTDAEDLIREYFRKRELLYQFCGVPFPLKAG